MRGDDGRFQSGIRYRSAASGIFVLEGVMTTLYGVPETPAFMPSVYCASIFHLELLARDAIVEGHGVKLNVFGYLGNCAVSSATLRSVAPCRGKTLYHSFHRPKTRYCLRETRRIRELGSYLNWGEGYGRSDPACREELAVDPCHLSSRSVRAHDLFHVGLNCLPYGHDGSENSTIFIGAFGCRVCGPRGDGSHIDLAYLWYCAPLFSPVGALDAWSSRRGYGDDSSRLR